MISSDFANRFGRILPLRLLGPCARLGMAPQPSEERSKIMNLKFTRKLTKSFKNKGAQITIPRCIAEVWADFNSIDMIFDGRCLVVAPSPEEQ